MTQQATLGMWLVALEHAHGSMRAASEAYGIDPGYWWRLRSGEKTNPSPEVLERLGLRVSAVLYERAST